MSQTMGQGNGCRKGRFGDASSHGFRGDYRLLVGELVTQLPGKAME
jgi:hypothetical protein